MQMLEGIELVLVAHRERLRNSDGRLHAVVSSCQIPVKPMNSLPYNVRKLGLVCKTSLPHVR